MWIEKKSVLQYLPNFTLRVESGNLISEIHIYYVNGRGKAA